MSAPEMPPASDDDWRPDHSDESGRQADPATIVDAIMGALTRHGVEDDSDTRRQLRESDWNDPVHRRYVMDSFSEFDEPILPGMGPNGRARNTDDDCGRPHAFICDGCGKRTDFGRTCAQSLCARCAVVWNRDRATAKVAKVRRLRKNKHADSPADEHQKLHHLAISPPLAWYQMLADRGLSLEEAQDTTQEVVKAILDELRAQGVVARHSFRGRNDDGSVSDEHDDRQMWKELIFSDREWGSDVRDQLAWKPHYHAVVVADRVHVVNEDADPDERPNLPTHVERETGWSIHRIESRQDGKKSLPTDGAMAGALTYNFSHADIRRDVNTQGHSRAQIWEVGSYRTFHPEQGEYVAKSVKSNPDLTPEQRDLDWAAAVVREKAETVLGLTPTSSTCSASIPAVDDPDELARRVLESIFPGEPERVEPDHVLHHLAQGNIEADVSTTDGGGGRVTVRDAWGHPVGDDGLAAGGGFDVPEPATPTDDRADDLRSTALDDTDCGDDCGCAESSNDDGCGGRFRPIQEARENFLRDREWQANAPHADEALEADREYPDPAPAFQVDPPADSGPLPAD